MRENLLKKQPTWGLRRAQGTGQKSATPATLTKVILVLLTMFLLPSAAWGQTTVTKTITFTKNKGDVVTIDNTDNIPNAIPVTVNEKVGSNPDDPSYGYDSNVMIINSGALLNTYSYSNDKAVFTLDEYASTELPNWFVIRIPGNYPEKPTEVTLYFSYTTSTSNEDEDGYCAKIQFGNEENYTDTGDSGGSKDYLTTGLNGLKFSANGTDGIEITGREGTKSLDIYIFLDGENGVSPTFTIEKIEMKYSTDFYNLSVAGIPVTGVNKDDVLNNGTVKPNGTLSGDGTVSFTEGALTLNKASISGGGIYTTLENLEIDLVNTNAIETGSGTTGQGTSTRNGIMSTKNGTLTFVTASGGSLEITSTAAAIKGFQTINGNLETHVPYTIKSKNDNYPNQDLYRTCEIEGDSVAIKWIKISEAQTYPLWIAGTQVTESNKGNVLGDSKVSFKPAEGNTPATLTLDKATLGTYIKSTIKDLKVHLSGNNTITSSDGAFIYNGTESDPILTFSTVDPSDYENLGMLTINGINSKDNIASGYAIKGLVGETSTAIDDWGEDRSSTLDTSVSGWKYEENSTSNQSFVKLLYREVYDLWISSHRYYSGGLSYTSENFNPTTSTLTFNNIHGDTYQIYSGIPALTIEIGGDNELKAISFGARDGETISATSGTLTIKKDETSTSTVHELTLANADTDGGVISGFSSVTIEEPMGVKSPSPFTTWEGTHNAIISDAQFYDLWVGGVQVTSGNASNIIGDQSSQPKAVFDAENSTLTLNGLQIFNSTTSPNFIESGLENLTVILSGENKFMKGGDVTTSYGFKVQGDKTRKITFTTSNNGSLYIETNAENAVVGFTNVTYNDGLAPYMGGESKYYIAPVTLEKPAFTGNYDEEDSSKLLSVSIDSHATSTIDGKTVTILAYDVVYTVDGGSETAYSESEPITISGPCTLTAKTIVGNKSSEVATGKYFGAKQEVFTMAIGESLADLDWCTPSFNAETEYLICNFISESSIFNYDVDNSSKPISTKASGTGTINIELSYNDRMVTQILNNTDSPIATLTINVGESLNSVFEGENTFGGLYNDSDTPYALPEKMTAYLITGISEDGTSVSTQSIDYLPARTAVLLQRKEGAKAITKIPYEGSATAPTNNKLNYSDPNSPAKPSTTDNWYVLYNNKFVKVTTGTPVRGGKCYLNLNGTSSAGTRGFYDIDGSDGTTAIKDVKSGEVDGEKWADGGWHDLQGRRFSAKPTKPGLYILNGKKVVIK